jgi:hypothetical protein
LVAYLKATPYSKVNVSPGVSCGLLKVMNWNKLLAGAALPSPAVVTPADRSEASRRSAHEQAPVEL